MSQVKIAEIDCLVLGGGIRRVAYRFVVTEQATNALIVR
jgi:hypothetical protein